MRVTATVVAFHAPGKKEGMQMEGKEGVVETVTDTAKLSATQPYRVKFSWEEGGKDKTKGERMAKKKRKESKGARKGTDGA